MLAIGSLQGHVARHPQGHEGGAEDGLVDGRPSERNEKTRSRNASVQKAEPKMNAGGDQGETQKGEPSRSTGVPFLHETVGNNLVPVDVLTSDVARPSDDSARETFRGDGVGFQLFGVPNQRPTK